MSEIYTCLICNRTFTGNRAPNALSKHLKAHKTNSYDYYHEYVVPTLTLEHPIGICIHPDCNNLTIFKNFAHGYTEHCSSKCAAMDNDVKEKRKNTMLTTYGFPHNFSGEQEIRPCDQTMIAKYGVKNAIQHKPFREKQRQTMLKLYGIEHNFNGKYGERPCDITKSERYTTDEIYDKHKSTMLNIYGVDNYFKRPDLVKDAVNSKYGVDYIMQVDEIRSRAQSSQKQKSYRLKKYDTIFGTTVTYQSMLEYYFIRYCEKNNIPISDAESIFYYHNNKKRKYYIDFKIFKDGTYHLVELKGQHIWYEEQLKSGMIVSKNSAAATYSKCMGYGDFIYYLHEGQLNNETDFGMGSINSIGVE